MSKRKFKTVRPSRHFPQFGPEEPTDVSSGVSCGKCENLVAVAARLRGSRMLGITAGCSGDLKSGHACRRPHAPSQLSCPIPWLRAACQEMAGANYQCSFRNSNNSNSSQRLAPMTVRKMAHPRQAYVKEDHDAVSYYFYFIFCFCF